MKNEKQPSIMMSSKFVSVTFDAKNYIVQDYDDNFEQVKNLIKEKNWEKLKTVLDIPKAIKLFSKGDYTVCEDMILYKGEQVDSPMAKRVLEFVKEGFPYEPLVYFMDNISECRHDEIKKELYSFLESNETMPITEDGAFLAYRVVDENYFSFHENPDGTHNSNKVGDVNTMDIDDCEFNREKDCSTGLHFCSKTYIPKYTPKNACNYRVMIVKVFPQDVASIPYKFNHAKGRCCRYEVVAECEDLNDLSHKSSYYAEDKNIEDSIDDLFDDSKNQGVVQKVNKSVESVNRILERRLKTKKDEVTVRSVCKSTKPYVNATEVLLIVEKNPLYKIKRSGALSQAIIKKK